MPVAIAGALLLVFVLLVRPQEFLLTGIIAVGICLAATVVPALHAARIRPADGLRAQ